MHLSLQHKDVEEAESAFKKEMEVEVEEDLFDVVFFLCGGFAVCNTVGLDLRLKFIRLNVN
jgi:hypothetical protein